MAIPVTRGVSGIEHYSSKQNITFEPGAKVEISCVEEAPNPNIFWVGEAGFEADNDRVIVLQDVYRSGFECPKCLDEGKHTISGREVSTIACEDCEGKGQRQRTGMKQKLLVKCSTCEGRGWHVCPECGGKGGTIILADNQKGRPTTGTLVSIGPKVKDRERGQKVMYPSFSGNAYDLKGVAKDGRVVDVILVVLRDEEIISKMYGTLEQNNVKGAQARYTNA